MHQKNQIHMWMIDNVLSWADENSSVLTPGEIDRASRFQFASLRRRFLAGRIWLRTVLGHHISCPPDALRFMEQPLGKPYVVEPKIPLEFNFSRSQESCVCAVTCGRRVGIDIESMKSLDDMRATAKTIFDGDDLDSWNSLGPHQRREAFFRSWTKKEAVAKANGKGISQGVERIRVPVEHRPMKSSARIEMNDKAYLVSDVEFCPNIAVSIAVEVPFALHSDQYHDVNYELPASVLPATKYQVRTLELKS